MRSKFRPLFSLTCVMATPTSRNFEFSMIIIITTDWLLVDKSKEGSPTTMTEEAAHNHHVVAKCLDPEVS